MNLPRRHLLVGSVIYQEGQHVMHAQLGTSYSTVAARLYTSRTLLLLSLAHKASVVVLYTSSRTLLLFGTLAYYLLVIFVISY